MARKEAAMGRLFLISAVFALGCGSSSSELRAAEVHQHEADQAAARGDYQRAAREQDHARRERQEAFERSRSPGM